MEIKHVREGAPAWLKLSRVRKLYTADKPACRGPRDVVRLMSPLLTEEVEVFAVLMLDAQHNAMGAYEVSRGIVDSTLVHPREVFRAAIIVGAVSVVLVHNHPSGDPNPSHDDKLITSKMVEAGRTMDIPVHDHVIVAAKGFISFAEQGLI
jgi:DNA repair protein RadC